MRKRIVILALGSHVDVQPCVTLGAALQQRGHAVTVATFESFQGLVAGAGLRHVPVPGDAQALTAQMMSADGISSRNPLRLIRKLMDTFGKAAKAYSHAFSTPAMLEGEVILDQLPGGIFGRDLAEKTGAAYFSIAVIPLLRTTQFAAPLLAAKNLGAPLNDLSYRLSETLLWHFFRPAVAYYRGQLGLTAPSRFFRPSRAPVLMGISPKVVPPPPDWAKTVHLTGWWRPADPDWQPPADLQAFLGAGEPPVFIGFGSMIANDPATFSQTVFEAIRLSGVRAVIGKGWGTWDDSATHDQVFQVGFTPYSWLFPRMAAVVHHGGSGTTGAALTSGVPSMVVAFGADQPFWGQRTAALGAGVPPLHIKTLTAEALAASLRRLVSDPTLKVNAATLGAQLQAERGLENAVAALEGYGVR
jgi:UDP:flavonoid glycosyltransferase YjiC (YdhE family)